MKNQLVDGAAGQSNEDTNASAYRLLGWFNFLEIVRHASFSFVGAAPLRPVKVRATSQTVL